MLVKQSKGDSFYGCVAYVLNKSGAEPLDSNMAGQSVIALAEEFEQLDSVRSSVQRRLYHCSLSLPTGEHLDDRTWRNLAQDYLEDMGFGGHQYLVVRHTDTPSHEHVHIVANRVGSNGHVATDSWDAYRAQVVAKALEERYDLTPTQTSWNLPRKALSKQQLEKEKKTGVASIQRQLQDAIETIASQSAGFVDLTAQLDDRGITLKVSYGYADQPIGVSYSKDGVTMSGSSLGRGYSWAGIQQQMGIDLLEAHPAAEVGQVRSHVTTAIDRFTSNQPTLPELLEQLHEVGIVAHVRYKRTKGGKQQAEAISFSQGAIAFPGEALGPEYHFKGLQASVDYQPDRDDAWIRQWQAYQAGTDQPPGASPKKSQTFEKKVAPVIITQLEPHQVFVFGSSLDGMHARGYGQWAIWGQGKGYQQGETGNSYAIATKQKWTSKKSLPLAAIAEQVDQFIEFAQAHPDKTFLLSQFHDRAMVKIWRDRVVPENVRLPEPWLKQLQSPAKISKTPRDRTRRVVISGNMATQFNQQTGKLAIGQLTQAVEAAFHEAQTQGIDRLQFVSGLTPGIEHWGAVAALRLREQQANQEIPALPKIEVVAAVANLDAIQRCSKKAKEQYQRVIEASDRVESSPVTEYLATMDDRLLLVAMAGQAKDSRLQREALSRNIPIHEYTVVDSMQRPQQQR
jgi:Relaxase/Mobilisation nuclease domain